MKYKNIIQKRFKFLKEKERIIPERDRLTQRIKTINKELKQLDNYVLRECENETKQK